MHDKHKIHLARLLAVTFVFSSFTAVAGEVTHASDMTNRAANQIDRQFLQQAADESAAEVAMAQLALRQATAVEVRQLAQQLLDDHMQMIRDMVKLSNLKQDAQPAKPTPKDQQQLQQLQAQHGKDFDHAYLHDMVQAHQDAVELYNKAARDGTDPDVKQYAQDKLPILQHHLSLSRKLAGDSGGKS